MPRSRDGRSASARSAARTGVSSPTSCRSASSPAIVAGAADGEPGVVAARPRRPSRRAARAARRRPGSCAPASAARVTAPPVATRGGEERRGVGEVGLDRRGRRPAIGPGATRQLLGVGVVDVDAALRSTSTVISMCGCDGTAPVPACTTSMPLSKRGAGQQQRRRRTATTPTRRSAPCRRRRAPLPWTVNGSRPRPPSSTSAPAWRSPSSSVAIGRSRAYASPSKVTSPVGQRGDRRHEAHDRAGQPGVDRPAAQWRRA